MREKTQLRKRIKLISNICKVTFVIFTICFTILSLNIDILAEGEDPVIGPASLKQLNKQYLDDGLNLAEGNNNGILLTFNMNAALDETYVLSYMTSYNDAVSGEKKALKQQFTFKKTAVEYKQYKYSDTDNDYTDNDTANFGSILSKISGDILMASQIEASAAERQNAKVSINLDTKAGDAFSTGVTTYAVKYLGEGDATKVYFYFTIPQEVKNTLYEFELTNGGTPKKIGSLINMSYTSKTYIDKTETPQKEYLKVTVNKVTFFDKTLNKFIEGQIPNSYVGDVVFSIWDINNIKSTKEVKLSNDKRTSDAFVKNVESFYDDNKGNYICYIRTDDNKIKGSSIFYIHMNGTKDVYMNEEILKCYTDPAFDVERRNYKEAYVSIEPYPQGGTYSVMLQRYEKHGSNYVSIDGEFLGYAYQYVPLTSTLKNIMVPIYIEPDKDYRYDIKVVFEPEGEVDDLNRPISVTSGVLEYYPKDVYQINVGVPLRVEANNVIVIKDPTDDSTKVAKFDISFDTPEGIFDLCKKQSQETSWDPSLPHIWFEVHLNTELKDSATEKYAIADVIYLRYIKTGEHAGQFEITTLNTTDKTGTHSWTGYLKENDERLSAQIVLKQYDYENYTNNPNNFGYFSHYYYGIDDEFDIFDVYDDNEKSYILKPGYEDKLSLYTEYTGTGIKKNKYFYTKDKVTDQGSNYYLSLRSIYAPIYGSGKATADCLINPSDMSVPVNIVLQVNSDVIPVTDDLKFTTVVGTTDIDQSNELAGIISEVNKGDYEDKMLKPIDETLGAVRYEVYMAEDLAQLKGVMESVKINESNNDLIVITDGEFDETHPVVFTTNVKVDEGFNIGWLRNKGNPTLSTVRKGVYAFYTSDVLKAGDDTTKKGSMYVKGLDSNTTYYFAIRTVFEIDGAKRFSDFSKIVYKSTSTNPVIPKKDEILPPAPEDFRISTDVITDDTKTAVRWKQPENIDVSNYTYAYEVVRVADERLTKTQKDTSLTLKDLNAYNLKQFIALRADKPGSFSGYATGGSTYPSELGIYDSGSMRNINADDLVTLTTFPTNVFKIEDSGLKPNRIYFYYVRTVQKYYDEELDKEKEVYSEWAEITVTTIPIEGIINLREVTIPSRYNIKDFDGYYERIIAFDAPKGIGIEYGDGNTTKKLPDDKLYSISIKEYEEQEEYDNDYAKHCTLEAIIDNGNEFATYVYRVSKLKSGTKYQIRVAAIDTSIVDDDNSFPTSSYSDPIVLRTEFNQDDYDRETKYKEYEKYYNAVLGKINNDSYFVLDNTTSSYTVKFKEDKFQGALAAAKTTTFELPTTDTATSYTYYISNANIKEMMRLKKGISIEHNGIKITIPYNFINDDYNEFYGTLLKNCTSLQSEVEDFYMKLWVGFNTPQNYVEGNKTVSDQVQIAMKFIEQDSLNADLDGQLEQQIDDYIEGNKSNFFVDVKAQLNNKIDDAKMIEFVEDEEEEIREYIQKAAANYYSEYEMESYSLKDLYNRIDFKFKTNDYASKIYTKPTNDLKWTKVSTTNSAGYANGYITKLGTTVLTSSANTSVIYGDDKTANAYYEKSKYDLDNVLIRNGSLKPETDKVSQDLFKDIAFAVMQPDITNPFDLANLKQKLDSTFAFKNDPLTKEEVLYGIMQIYDEFSTININQVVINNANQAKGINFSSYYKQSILAGYQLGLLGLDDISNPKGYMSVNDMLDILYRVIG